MNRTQKIVIDSLKKAYDEGQNIFRRPSMQTAFGVINAQNEQLIAAQARISELEAAIKEIASRASCANYRNQIDASDAFAKITSIAVSIVRVKP